MARSTLGHRVVTVLRVGSIRFSAFYFVSFYTAIEMCGRGGARWILLGAAFCLVLCLGIELANRYADRVEDVVNRPERTRLCEEVGFPTIRNLTIAIFALLAVPGIAWLYCYRNLGLFVVQALVWLVALNYSVGLRFKGRRYASLVILGGTFVLPFLVAWSMYASPLDLPPPIVIVPCFIFSIAGIKDITDVEGDRQRGYRSLFVDLLRTRSTGRLLLWLALPYLLTAALVAAGVVQPRFLALFALVPGSLVFAVLVRHAGDREEAETVREWMYHFWFVILVFVLLLLGDTARLRAVLGGAAVFWVLATRHLHWRRGLTLAQLAIARRIVRRAAGRPA